MEKTFIFIKPDGVERGLVGEVLRRFEQRGLTISELKKMTVSGDLSDKHYAEHIEKPFYAGLKEYVTSGPVVAAIIEGENSVKAVREMCGATNPIESAPGTIRGDFGLTLDANIIHSSDGTESAAREISNFF
ncbi:nucleoside-diphosphate kinase [Candidatus Marinamargulisbacteria bacterium SCGC AAA071-K20]|nr:nucleoside-diphosphate kinase [Candidatus Marinamargulisbacteria bacterium SCGC AAA071-K20]